MPPNQKETGVEGASAVYCVSEQKTWSSNDDNAHEQNNAPSLPEQTSQKGLLDAPDISKPSPEYEKYPKGFSKRVSQAYLDNYVLLGMTVAFCFTISGAGIKVITHDVSVYQALASRAIFCLPIMCGISWWRGHRIVESRELVALCVLRGVTGASAFLCWAFAAYALPLSEAAFMTNSYPVVTALLSWTMGMEPLGVYSWAGVIGCVIGNALMAHPTFLFGGHADWGTKRVLGLIVAGCANVLMGSTYIVIGYIGKRVSGLVLTVYTHFFVLIICVPFLLAEYPRAVNMHHSFSVLLCYAGICISGLVAQFTLTRALQVGPPTKTTALFLTNMVLSGIVGVFLLGEGTSWSSIVGSFVIVVSVLTVVLQPKRKRQARPANGLEETFLMNEEGEAC